MTALSFLPLPASPAPASAASRGRSTPEGFGDVLAAHRSTGGRNACVAGDDVPDEERSSDAGADSQALLPLASWISSAVAPNGAPSSPATQVTGDAGAPLGTDGEVATPLDGGDPATSTRSTVPGEGGYETLTTTLTVDDAPRAGEVPVTTTDLPGAGAQVRADVAPVVTTGPAPSPGAETGRTARAVPVTPATPAAASSTTPVSEADPATETTPGSPAEPAVAAAPAGGARGRPEVANPRAAADGVSTRADGVAASTTAPRTEQAPAPSGPVTPSSAAQRVLDLVAQLEDAPPPRVVVIETGEIRVRIGLDAGTVRLTVLGPLAEAGEEILREAADALEAGGYGTELDRGAADGDGDDRSRRDQEPTRPTAAAPARPPARPRTGLQL
jgi:hypothetical protein